MSKFYKVLSVLILALVLACSEDDELPAEIGNLEEDLYSNALVSAKEEQLTGVWAIYEITYQGITAKVPASFEECGRDFFQFIGNGTYRETIYISDYECEKQVLDLNWEMDEGIINLSNSAGMRMEMVIVELKTDKMVFKSEVDIDEDGEAEVLRFTARQYSPPNDPDLYSYTFQPSSIESSEDKIKLEWESYNGFYDFDRYEIYRSKNECNKSSAELLASIEEVSETSFIDENPPAQGKICYFFKIYNEKGLLGESEMLQVYTEYLIPAKVEFSEVNIFDEKIELNWQPYAGNYFSHYEITVRNYKEGSGYGFQEESVVTIEGQEVDSFIDENPPYMLHPVYAIYAYDIFGNKSVSSSSGENAWTVVWEHPEVLKFGYIRFMAIDEEEPYIYLYGSDSQKGGFQLIKYDYRNQQVVGSANKLPSVSTSIDMQILETSNGKELFFPQGSNLSVYDAEDLSFKYSLRVNKTIGFRDFAHLGNNIWAFTDGTSIATYKRENGNLDIIEEKEHFSTHHGSGNHQLIPLKDNLVLVGHEKESQSFKFSIDTYGNMSEGELVELPIKSFNAKETYYSPDQDYILNVVENRLYSTHSFSFQSSFEKPYYPTGISRDGTFVLGSNNDPEWDVNNESIHEKKATAYNVITGQIETFETKGYPLLVFENHQGQIISISSGFKRQSIRSTSPKPDLFVEVVKP